MSSTVLDEETTTVTINVNNDGDHDKFQHYFSKKDISDNILFGTPMHALCGKTVYQQVDPKGRTICPECKDKWEAMEWRKED